MDKALACYPGGRGSIQAGNYNPRPVMPHTADGALLVDFYASKIGKSIVVLRDSNRKSLDSKVVDTTTLPRQACSIILSLAETFLVAKSRCKDLGHREPHCYLGYRERQSSRLG